MTIYLVRHAKAGSRSDWSGTDDQRPVSKNGHRQALALAETFAGSGITRIYSSPYVRCVQTIEPLANKVRVPVDLSDALAEGAPIADALALVEKVSGDDALLCSHGDVIGNILARCERLGVRLEGDGLEKASTWVLDIEAGEIIGAQHLPPPST